MTTKRKRQFAPVFYLVASAVAFIAALDFILGNPFASWMAALPTLDEPLLGALTLMLIVAIAPIIYLVSRGEDENGR